jgi:hypothetical protein
MNLKDKVEKYLEAELKARERVNKDRAIVNILMTLYDTNFGLTKDQLIKFVQDYNSMDRYWRLILADRKDLRGSDYETKEVVEQRKEIELGYESGYQTSIKNLKMI